MVVQIILKHPRVRNSKILISIYAIDKEIECDSITKAIEDYYSFAHHYQRLMIVTLHVCLGNIEAVLIIGKKHKGALLVIKYIASLQTRLNKL